MKVAFGLKDGYTVSWILSSFVLSRVVISAAISLDEPRKWLVISGQYFWFTLMTTEKCSGTQTQADRRAHSFTASGPMVPVARKISGSGG